MRRIKFIINPIAGKGRGVKFLETIKHRMDESKIEYDISLSNYLGEEKSIASRSVEEGYTDIISVGGDGTLLETFNGIVGKDVVLGIIPSGTGNDFIKAIGISKDIEENLNKIIEGNYKYIDYGTINDSYFLNVAGMGIDAEILINSTKFKKFLKGGLVYLFSTMHTLRKYKCTDVTIIADGKKMKRKIYLVAVGNGNFIGGGMNVCPNAKVDDGFFELVIVNELKKSKFIRLFPSVYKGTHIKEDPVEVIYAKKVEIIAHDKLHINADGNIIGSDYANMEIVELGQKIIM